MSSERAHKQYLFQQNQSMCGDNCWPIQIKGEDIIIQEHLNVFNKDDYVLARCKLNIPVPLSDNLHVCMSTVLLNNTNISSHLFSTT